MRDNSELSAITAVIVGFCALGLAGSMWPAVEDALDLAAAIGFGLGALGVLGYLVREVRRELLFRAEMHAFDRRDAARLGITRQAAHQRWAHLEPGTHLDPGTLR